MEFKTIQDEFDYYYNELKVNQELFNSIKEKVNSFDEIEVDYNSFNEMNQETKVEFINYYQQVIN